jgi:hypothetical protein
MNGFEPLNTTAMKHSYTDIGATLEITRPMPCSPNTPVSHMRSAKLTVRCARADQLTPECARPMPPLGDL